MSAAIEVYDDRGYGMAEEIYQECMFSDFGFRCFLAFGIWRLNLLLQQALVNEFLAATTRTPTGGPSPCHWETVAT
jgi:hypothetical protein